MKRTISGGGGGGGGGGVDLTPYLGQQVLVGDAGGPTFFDPAASLYTDGNGFWRFRYIDEDSLKLHLSTGYTPELGIGLVDWQLLLRSPDDGLSMQNLAGIYSDPDGTKFVEAFMPIFNGARDLATYTGRVGMDCDTSGVVSWFLVNNRAYAFIVAQPGQTASLAEFRAEGVGASPGAIVREITVTGADRFIEQADPATPAANSCLVYAKDTGEGVTELVARFPTGHIQVLGVDGLPAHPGDSSFQIEAWTPPRDNSGWSTLSFNGSDAGYAYRTTDSSSDGNWIEYERSLSPGVWDFYVFGPHHNNSGKIDLSIDSTTVGTIDLYNAGGLDWQKVGAIEGVDLTGPIGLSGGVVSVRFTVNGKNASSSGFNSYFKTIVGAKRA